MTANSGLEQEMQLLQGKRIFFGHQSVGADIVRGLRELSATTTRARLPLVSLQTSTLPKGPFFADAFIGENEKPNTKCDAFREMVDALIVDSLNIAFMKFCFVDIMPDTDVEAMFRHYASTMDTLKAKYTNVTFVHMTVPLTTRTSLWKQIAKKILGRPVTWPLSSIKTQEFNTMLRNRYDTDPIFDLAKVESTYPDGSRNSFEYEGKMGYNLVSDYTYDGGHLNDSGRRLVARELIRTLAAVVRGSVPR